MSERIAQANAEIARLKAEKEYDHKLSVQIWESAKAEIQRLKDELEQRQQRSMLTVGSYHLANVNGGISIVHFNGEGGVFNVEHFEAVVDKFFGNNF
jgi:uncharacterized small protein (DUF1192 family)